MDGRLVVHRIGRDDVPEHSSPSATARLERELDGLKATDFPNQWFAWHAAFIAEKLIADEGIDLIEGQEWEAPLYYLLLRRAAGLSDGPLPPCIVHLHSATAFIRHYNGALGATRTEQLMERMEEFCIHSADALLCPSRYYALQCVDHFDLPQGSIEVIPLPVGISPAPERDAGVWTNGSICFVGRIEPRKGVIEWVTAATRVAAERPDVHFDFVGADQIGLQRALEARIAPELRSRFRFHGSQPRESLPRYLAAARAAVVPSRWENFPNVCIEAMSSGLPVIATRLGGMVELLEDGRTGWLTDDDGVAGMVDGLAAALKRCLATSPESLAEMGTSARRAVTQICDRDSVASAHLAFRETVARRGASRSLHGVAPSQSEPSTHRHGAGVVIRVESAVDAGPLLSSLSAQTVRPAATALVCTEQQSEGATRSDEAITVLQYPDVAGTGAWNAGFSALRSSEIGYWVFLDQHDVLEPTLLERVGQIFTNRPDVGIVVPWTLRSTGRPALEAPPCADLANQLIDNDVAPASAFRTEALGDEPPFKARMRGEFATWKLANDVLLKGWIAVTLPELLAIRREDRAITPWPESTALRAVRAEVLAGFAGTMSRTTLDLIQEHVPLPRADRAGLRPARDRRYARAIVDPRKVARALRSRIGG